MNSWWSKTVSRIFPPWNATQTTETPSPFEWAYIHGSFIWKVLICTSPPQKFPLIRLLGALLNLINGLDPPRHSKNWMFLLPPAHCSMVPFPEILLWGRRRGQWTFRNSFGGLQHCCKGKEKIHGHLTCGNATLMNRRIVHPSHEMAGVLHPY